MKKFILIGLTLLLTFPAFGEKIIPLPHLLKPKKIAADNHRFYVIDGIKIYIYSLKDFSLIKKFGEEGEGPGKFKGEVFGISFKDGQIIVNSAGRITYLTEDGKYIKEKNAVLPRAGGYIPVGDHFVGLQVAGDGKRIYKIINIFDANLGKIKEIFRIEDDLKVGKELKAFIEPQGYDVQDDKIIVTFNNEFLITLFNEKGEKLLTIKEEYERLKVADEQKKAVDFFYRTDPYYKQYYNRIKRILTFPTHLPAIRYIFCADKKIYAQTYKKEKGQTELFIFDMKGNLLKKVFIPFIEKEFAYNDMSLPFHHTVRYGKLYQLVENEDEEWELHITGIK